MSQLTRRNFAKATLAAGAGTALSRTKILGANDRVNLGIIGPGDRGHAVWTLFLKQPDINPVAAADVFKPYLERAGKTAGGKIA
ncbi:MAG: gfo/Idh/MocA family oxidoreductase, partial [Acidobacteriota bacterium]